MEQLLLGTTAVVSVVPVVPLFRTPLRAWHDWTARWWSRRSARVSSAGWRNDASNRRGTARSRTDHAGNALASPRRRRSDSGGQAINPKVSDAR
jgi:hypothetical protein